MSYASARQMGRHDIPVIDIGPLRDGSDPESVAQAILRASQDIGFLYVGNHGIADRLIADTRDAGLAFFRQPVARKVEVAINSHHHGFLKIGDSKMEEDALPDLKESFVWGFEPSPDAPANALRGENQWPRTPAGLQQQAMDYFEAAHDVARHLLRAAGLGLGIDARSFLAGSQAPVSRGSLTYYPPQPESLGANQFGVAPHTDFGVLTVLAQDDVGGLQVQSYDGDWIEAPPIAGTLVINVGDLLARWSNDKFRSTPHRVINQSGRERLSLVVAYDPDFDTVIDPAIACGTDEAPKYDVISCGDYLTWRFGRSFDYRDPA